MFLFMKTVFGTSIVFIQSNLALCWSNAYIFRSRHHENCLTFNRKSCSDVIKLCNWEIGCQIFILLRNRTGDSELMKTGGPSLGLDIGNEYDDIWILLVSSRLLNIVLCNIVRPVLQSEWTILPCRQKHVFDIVWLRESNIKNRNYLRFVKLS